MPTITDDLAPNHDEFGDPLPAVSHTPGPWHINQVGGQTLFYVAADGHVIASLLSKADARLISTCPDLLAACREALRIARIPSAASQAEALNRAEAMFAEAVAQATATK